MEYARNMSPPEQADKPFWPRAAASAAVFRDGKVLLVQRAQGASQGRWSLPGGKIEPGETAAAAAAREVREETTIEASLIGLLDLHEVINRATDGALTAHYLLAVFYGSANAGEPVGQSDAAIARFVLLDDLDQYALTDSAARLIREGYRRFTSARSAVI